MAASRAISLFLLAGLLVLSGMMAPADTERLRRYYEKLLEAEPDNERARSFLGLPSAQQEIPGGGELPDAAAAPWISSLKQNQPEAAWDGWSEAWQSGSASQRAALARAGVAHFPAGMLPGLLEKILPSFAPDAGIREEILMAAAHRLAGSPAAGEVLDAWMAGAKGGDRGMARAGAALAAREGRPREWAELLQLERSLGGQPEQLWESLLADGQRDAARQAVTEWLQRSPDSARARLARLEISLLDGDGEAAARLLHDWLASPSAPRRSVFAENLMDLSERLGWRHGEQTALRLTMEQRPEEAAPRLALLRHHLAWQMPDKAREVEMYFPDTPLPKEEKLSFWEQAAALYQQFGQPAEAVRAAGKALAEAGETPPDATENDNSVNRERLLSLLAESLRLAGKDQEAAALLQVELAPDRWPLPSVSLDRELFGLLSRTSSAATTNGNGGANGRPLTASSRDLQRVVPARRGLTREVRDMISSLQTAAEGGTAEARVRLARWHEWTDDWQRADAVLREALNLWPESELLQESALVLARKTRNREREREILTVLGETGDPAGRLRWQRELAFINLQSEDPDEVETGFDYLQNQANQDAAPASAWQDLALAHESRDQWFAAWSAWREAWTRAGDSGLRAGIRVGGERAAARIGRLAEWQEITALPLEPERAAGEEGEGALLAFTTKQTGLPGDLRTLRAREPAAWLAAGEEIEQSDRAAALEFWREAAERFPRHAGVLRRAAAALHPTAPGETANLLLLAYEIAPPDAAAALELAEVLQQTGDRTRAVDFYDKVVSLDPPALLPRAIAIHPVDLSPEERRRLTALIFRLRSASGTWSGGWAALMEPPAVSPLPPRLRALRALGKILGQGEPLSPERRDWLSSLSLAERVEFLASLGGISRALEELQEQINNDPLDYQATLSYLRLAMAAGLWQEALAFVGERQEDAPERVDFFLYALGERLLAGQEWQELVEIADAAAQQPWEVLRWPFARLLAETGHYQPALLMAQPGLRHLPLDIQTDALWQTLQWSLRLGEVEKAREILATAPSLCSDLLAMEADLLRARFLLSPEAGRNALLDEHFQRPEETDDLSVASTRFLLAALASLPLEDEARRLVEQISSTTFGAGDRRMFVPLLRAVVERLLRWRLTEAASALVETALEGDEALRTLRGQVDEWQRGELQVLATAAALSAQPASALRNAVGSMQNLLGDNRDFLPAVASTLAQTDDPARASLLFRLLWEGGDRRPSTLSAWWNVARTLGDKESFAIMRELLRRGEKLEDLSTPYVLLIDLALASRDLVEAEQLLQEAGERSVSEPGLEERRTALQFLNKDFATLRRRHGPLWQEDRDVLSGEILTRAAWLEGDQQRFFLLLSELAEVDRTVFLRVWDAALAEPALEPDVAASLAVLLQKVAPEQESARLLQALVLAGDWAAATAWLLQFPGMLTPELLRSIAAREEAARNLAPAFLSLAKGEKLIPGEGRAAAEFWQALDGVMVAGGFDQEWQEQLAGLWREGRGNSWAGEILLRSLARSQNQEALDRNLGIFLETREDDAFWPGLVTMLIETGHPAAALRVVEAWRTKGLPDEQKFAVALWEATAFNQSGEEQQARELLQPWEEVAALAPDYLLPLASWMKTANHGRRALRLHEEGLLRGPPSSRKAHAIGAAQAALLLQDNLQADVFLQEAAALPGPPEIPSSLAPFLKDGGF